MSTDDLPLAGVRVIDLSWIIAGPTATRFLATMGAEVIKVGSARRPDPSTRGAPFQAYNQSKLYAALNISRPEGIEMAKRPFHGKTLPQMNIEVHSNLICDPEIDLFKKSRFEPHPVNDRLLFVGACCVKADLTPRRDQIPEVEEELADLSRRIPATPVNQAKALHDRQLPTVETHDGTDIELELTACEILKRNRVAAESPGVERVNVVVVFEKDAFQSSLNREVAIDAVK